MITAQDFTTIYNTQIFGRAEIGSAIQGLLLTWISFQRQATSYEAFWAHQTWSVSQQRADK